YRFGFNNGSSIDSLLDKDDVSLEALLDEDDLLQECKAQNTRLSEYFSRVDVLKMLLGYVTGQTESEEKGRFKYPYIATEVLCSEIWTIVETCTEEQSQLLVPFWETVLDRPPDDMKTQMVMAAHFAKINSSFLSKKPAEMIEFIQRQPNIVERVLQHVETAPFVDILIRIIQLDENPAGTGVLEWLSSQGFIARLVDFLSPEHSTAVHGIVTEFIKGIISMATPSPNAGLTDANSNGPASNRFARELAKRETMEKLISFMLFKFDELPEDDDETPSTATASTFSSTPKPTRETATSSVTHAIAVVIELIRKNNSDYFEPYLFHTLRNRLIQVQQQIHTQGDDTRNALEEVMKEMVSRMGVVHLGPVLELACKHLGEFHEYLKAPRSLRGPISTTVGSITPLTLERYRILELLAELLHCSNMSLLNRPASFSHLYDSEGQLQGGLSALEELAAVIAMNNTTPDTRDLDPMDEEDDDDDSVTPARDFPVSSGYHRRRSASVGSGSIGSDGGLDSDDDMSEGEMEEISIAMEEQDRSSPGLGPPMEITRPFERERGPSPTQRMDVSMSPTASSLRLSPSHTGMTNSPRTRMRTPGHGSSRRSSRRRATLEASVEIQLPIGEQLKKHFLEMNLFGSLLDLFFDFPWNNFLHSTVYDLIHQVLTGNVETGRNRELAISLFRDAKIMQRITEGQARNDNDVSANKGGRLGYMGHLTLIAEDVITALDHFPPDLQAVVQQYAPMEQWETYVKGRYKETKANDTRLLGGGKPVVGSRSTQWKVDEDEIGTGIAAARPGSGHNRGGVAGDEDGAAGSGGILKTEFRRAGMDNNGQPKNTAHFLPSSVDDAGHDDEDDDEDSTRAAHFARYLEQEIHSSDRFNSSDDDDDDDDEGWLSQSAFVMRDSPLAASTRGSVSGGERRPLGLEGSSGFEDAFDPHATSGRTVDPFSRSNHMDIADDDGFGPFSDASSATLTASGSDFGDPFSFGSGSSLSDDDVVNSFDFGDFQNAEFAEAEADLDTFGDFGGNFEVSIPVMDDSTARGGNESKAEEQEGSEHKTPKPPSTAGWNESGATTISPASLWGESSDKKK
ncbi:phosphatase associated protein, partial [Coprinopsis sp. MPI-PUGE-AT-0042]